MPTDSNLVSLDVSQPIWERFYTVAPLIVVGSREETGAYDLAPKHMATPMGWDNYFGFVCTPSHGTYHNVKREGAFTVSFPRPNQVLMASFAAGPRCVDRSKPGLGVLPTIPAKEVDGVLLEDSYLFLECVLEQVIDGFGTNSLITGRIVAAHVAEESMRMNDRDDQEVLTQSPLVCYLPPGRYAKIERSFSFPFPKGFKKQDAEE